MNKKFLLLLSVAFLFISGCTQKRHKELWIYTSIYKDIIEMMKPEIEKEFPDIKIQWFASGSEKVSAKINAELEANSLQADILMTSDPFFYLELKNKELLIPYESPNAKNVPPYLKDSKHYFTTVRVPVIVLAYNQHMLRPDQAPTSFKELTEEKWKGKVVMGSPLESGTMFTAVSSLHHTYGWDFFKKLRQNNIVAAGGNSTVREKLESKEFSVGIILLENILQAQSQKSPLEVIYPQDGVILVPSPIAIFKRTHAPSSAKQFVDYFFTEKAQRWIIKANMYSPNPLIPPPEHAKSFGFVLKNSFPWNFQYAQTILKDHQNIKDTFSKIMYE